MKGNLTLRKKTLKDKVSSILNAGKYSSKADIYKKVFNEEELNALGQNNMIEINDKKKANTMNNTKNDEGFFLTQPNNITTEN